MRRRTHNYSRDNNSQENFNYDDKYVISGESEFSRDLTIPFDDNEVLSERHFVIGDDAFDWERRIRQEAGGEDYTGRGPRGYQRNDAQIYEDVSEALWRSPQVDASEIEVKVDQGIVRLQGVVHKRQFKRWAEQLIEHVPGVIDVMNEIRVEVDHGGLVQNRSGMI